MSAEPEIPASNVLVPKQQHHITAASALSALAILRGTEVTMRWEGAKLGMYFNIPGFAAVMSLLIHSPSRPTLVLIFLGALVAMLLNEYLYLSIRRSSRHMRLWNQKAVEVETICPIEGGVKVFTSEEYRRLQSHRLTIEKILLWITETCIVAWGAIFLMSLGAALFGGVK